MTMILKNNGNRTKWRPIRSVIIRVITKSTVWSSICLSRVVNHKSYKFRKKKEFPSYERKGKFALKRLIKEV